MAIHEFKCDECGREFASESAKSQHAAAVHGSEKIPPKFVIGKPAAYAIAVLAVAVIGYGLFLLASGSPAKYQAKPAPDFTLESTDGKTVSLSDFAEKKNALLFFSEGVGCDACWQQLADIQKKSSDFDGLDTEILTIVVNPPAPTIGEMRKWGISMPVLIDEGAAASRSYDALQYSMHPGQVPGHTFVFVDKNGLVRWRWDWKSGSMYYPVDAILLQLRSIAGK